MPKDKPGIEIGRGYVILLNEEEEEAVLAILAEHEDPERRTLNGTNLKALLFNLINELEAEDIDTDFEEPEKMSQADLLKKFIKENPEVVHMGREVLMNLFSKWVKRK